MGSVVFFDDHGVFFETPEEAEAFADRIGQITAAYTAPSSETSAFDYYAIRALVERYTNLIEERFRSLMIDTQQIQPSSTLKPRWNISARENYLTKTMVQKIIAEIREHGTLPPTYFVDDEAYHKNKRDLFNSFWLFL